MQHLIAQLMMVYQNQNIAQSSVTYSLESVLFTSDWNSASLTKKDSLSLTRNWNQKLVCFMGNQSTGTENVSAEPFFSQHKRIMTLNMQNEFQEKQACVLISGHDNKGWIGHLQQQLIPWWDRMILNVRFWECLFVFNLQRLSWA